MWLTNICHQLKKGAENYPEHKNVAGQLYSCVKHILNSCFEITLMQYVSKMYLVYIQNVFLVTFNLEFSSFVGCRIWELLLFEKSNKGSLRSFKLCARWNVKCVKEKTCTKIFLLVEMWNTEDLKSFKHLSNVFKHEFCAPFP